MLWNVSHFIYVCDVYSNVKSISMYCCWWCVLVLLPLHNKKKIAGIRNSNEFVCVHYSDSVWVVNMRWVSFFFSSSFFAHFLLLLNERQLRWQFASRQMVDIFFPPFEWKWSVLLLLLLLALFLFIEMLYQNK